ncbi:hypothetical protein ScPMuIL_012301 [Solemya velum]
MFVFTPNLKFRNFTKSTDVKPTNSSHNFFINCPAPIPVAIPRCLDMCMLSIPYGSKSRELLKTLLGTNWRENSFQSWKCDRPHIIMPLFPLIAT